MRFLALLILSACASKDVASLRGPANLYRADSHLQAAVLKIQTQEDKCSAAIVSDAGHVLTASHCLNLCHGINETVSCPIAGREVRFAVIKKHVCANDIEDSFEGVKDPALRHCVHEADVAILRVLEPKDLEPYSCFKVSAHVPSVHDQVLALGYPAETTRAEGENSDGENLFFSKGEVVDQPFCTKPDGRVVDFLTAMNSKWREMRSSGVFLQATTDNLAGASGGPLFNSAGEIVGVSSYSTRSLDYQTGPERWDHRRVGVQNEAEQCAGASFYANFKYLGKFVESLSCEKRKIRLSH